MAAHPSDTVVQRRLEREALDWLEGELGGVMLYSTRVVSASGHSVEFDGMSEPHKVAVEVFVGERVRSAQKNKIAADVLKLGVVAREVLGPDGRLIVLTPVAVQRALSRHWVSEVAGDVGVEFVGFQLTQLPSHKLLWAARMRQGRQSPS